MIDSHKSSRFDCLSTKRTLRFDLKRDKEEREGKGG